MRRIHPPNEFSDAVALTGMTLAQISEFLGRSPHTIQAYTSGTRKAPRETILQVKHLWEDAVYLDGPTDRYGNEIPEAAMAIRRAMRGPDASPLMQRILDGRERFPEIVDVRDRDLDDAHEPDHAPTP